MRVESDRRLAESEARLRHLDERSIDMIYRFRFLPEAGFDYVSGGVKAITGWTPEDFYSDPGLMFRMLHPEDRAKAAVLMQDPTDELHQLRLRLQHRDGHWVWTEHRTVPVVDEHGVLVASEAVARDISDQMLAETKLVESERVSRSVLESIPGPTAVLDANGTISMVNRAWHDYMRTAGGQVEHCGVGSDYMALCDRAASRGVDGAAEVSAGVRAVLAGAHESFQLDYPASGPDDDRWFSMDVSPMRTETGGAVVLHSDITDRKRYEEQLQHQALHDPLTGLPNRALLSDRLSGAIGRAQRDGNKVGVLLLDVDGFKVVNDALGHAAGDELLMSMSSRLAALVRPGDTVARLGGDEFVVLCEALGGSDEAAVVADRVVTGLARPVRQRDGGELSTTVSIGVAIGDGSTSADALLRDADAAMYHAKERGRNRFEMFATGFGERAFARLTLEETLKRAIENDEFRLLYQPIVELRSGVCVGMEALLRWVHPVRGILAPDEFLLVAEESGLIVPIGDWVLHEACRQRRRWQQSHSDAHPLPISVNVSAQQMKRPRFAQEVAAAIADAGITSLELVLELTERTLMDASVIPTAGQLHEIGVLLAVDDFGVGYSSLSYLKTLPIDQLKIDQSFIAEFGRNPVDTAIVSAIVSMTRALGIVALAEGVETPKQRDELLALGCELAQGFFYARPALPEQLDSFLRGVDPASDEQERLRYSDHRSHRLRVVG
jgi:diguanylate cyclase (GGDEF)-like protein/PAS domain S-box-containing protein